MILGATVRKPDPTRVCIIEGMRVAVTAVVLAGCATASSPSPIAPPPPLPRVLAQIEASRDLDGGVVGTSDAPATIVIVFASWCEHCRDELHVIDAVRTRHHVRVLGLNYKGHEEYDGRGGSTAVRAFVRATPWLRVIPANDALFTALGRPPLIPTLYVYDRTGALVTTFDRRQRAAPEPAEHDALLSRLGA